MSRSTKLWALATLIGSLAGAARAQEAEGDEYSAIIEEAVREFGAQRFMEARALFERAHRVAPSARTLRGIGLSSLELGDYPEAYRALGAALSDTNRPLTDEQRTAAAAHLDRVRGFLGVYRIVTRPEGAQLTIDGRPAVLEADGSVLLSLGTHDVVATLADHSEASTVVRVAGRESETIELALEPIEAPIAVRPDIEEATVDLPAARPHPIERSVDLALPGALFALGGGASAASIATGLAWWLHQEEQGAACAARPGFCLNPDEIAGARDGAAATTIVLAITGAALVLAGAVSLVVGESDGEPAARGALARPRL
jgi:tetratricopeptide (TPR) repeat protein